jgi:hypothetical protein
MKRRDEGIEQVSENAGNFMDEGLDAIRALAFLEITGEFIRRHLEEKGIKPHHVNAWGALINVAVKRKYLIPTERFLKSTSPKNHAHHYRVYLKGRNNAFRDGLTDTPQPKEPLDG